MNADTMKRAITTIAEGLRTAADGLQKPADLRTVATELAADFQAIADEVEDLEAAEAIGAVFAPVECSDALREQRDRHWLRANRLERELAAVVAECSDALEERDVAAESFEYAAELEDRLTIADARAGSWRTTAIEAERKLRAAEAEVADLESKLEKLDEVLRRASVEVIECDSASDAYRQACERLLRAYE